MTVAPILFHYNHAFAVFHQREKHQVYSKNQRDFLLILMLMKHLHLVLPFLLPSLGLNALTLMQTLPTWCKQLQQQ